MFGGDAQPRQAGFDPRASDFGFGQVEFWGEQPRGGVFDKRGAVMTGMQLGKGFQPNIELGKENFGLGLQDFQKLE